MSDRHYNVVMAEPTAFDKVALAARRAGLEVRDSLCIQKVGETMLGLLVRSPMRDTVVASVVRRGVGAIDIDACRISTTESTSRPAGQAPVTNMTTSTLHGRNYVSEDHVGGRYPSNLLLVHGSDCEQVGTKQVAANPSSVYWTSSGHNAWPGEDTERSTAGYASEDGTEEVADWKCQSDCPVHLLDMQSGVLHARGNTTPTKRSRSDGVTGWGVRQDGPINPGDEGGASRFFYQAVSQDDLESYLNRLVRGDHNG